MSDNAVRDDPENAMAKKIIEMAKELKIDHLKEFHLLPIAKHAVESPEDYVETIEAESEDKRPDITWFSKLVESERERYSQNPVEASPWLKLTEGEDSYYYNFETGQRANSLPGYRPRHRLDSPTTAESDLEVMKFTSWWIENGAKKYIQLHYFMKTEDFEIDIEEDDRIYFMKTIKGSSGPLACWDLHLKASINVFGKQISLLQCDQDTREWLRANAKRLIKLRRKLIDTLSKYELVREPPLLEGKKKPEEMHLRTIMNSIMRLKTKLSEHRPKLAGKFQL
jgi:hypothetical protein